MNPYDPNTHPGADLVAETLGVPEVSTLNTTYRLGSPLYQAATRMIGAAYELDARHDRVTVAARDALRLLEPVGRGELSGARVSYAILRTAVPKLGELITQQDRAYDQLIEAISAYQHLQPSTEHSTAKAHELHQEQSSGRDDDWAVAGDRRLRALEAVEAGGVRFRLAGIGDDPYVVWEKAQRQDPAIWPQTVQRLVADGLLHQDTGESCTGPDNFSRSRRRVKPPFAQRVRQRHGCLPRSTAATPPRPTAPFPTRPSGALPRRSASPRVPADSFRRKGISCPPPYSLPSSPSARSMLSVSRARCLCWSRGGPPGRR
ncbi:hypothetical protein [Streptomyces sp. NPDC048295]|uniref:hypothetical protein n=1 Tax=Streptomyces sp. NPDC048295 TaxID=3154617 RepID=UPI00343ED6ED